MKEELDILIKYAESLGVVVLFKTTKTDNAGEWDFGGKTIRIYETTLPRQYFALLHETSHQYEYIVSGKTLKNEETEAFIKEAGLKKNEVLDIQYRKVIYETEKNDAKHQLTIHKKIGSKVPVTKVKLEVALSNWIYRSFYKTGKYPNMKQRSIKRRELHAKYN